MGVTMTERYGMEDSPDVIHGRMKEGAHLAGYSLQRAIENLRWLLEDSRFEQLGQGYTNVNNFLRDTDDAFKLVNIKPEQRKEIAQTVKELQPKASQRAIADMVGSDHKTIGADLGGENSPKIRPKPGESLELIGEFSPPAIPPDDYDPVEKEQIKQKREAKRRDNVGFHLHSEVAGLDSEFHYVMKILAHTASSSSLANTKEK